MSISAQLDIHIILMLKLDTLASYHSFNLAFLGALFTQECELLSFIAP